MKTPSEKAKNTQIQRSQHPFFSKRGEHSFFGQTGVQAKIEVGEAGDAFEQEADSVAEKVVQDTGAETKEKGDKDTIQSKPLAESITPIVRRKQDDEETKIQKKGDEATPQTAPASVEKGISESQGSGSPMPTKVREDMESSFGTDFGGVRIHNDQRAESMSQEIGAQAFTHGNDIYFNKNKYNPSSHEGKKLLAHELTHTVQQGGSGVKTKKIQRGNDTQPPNTTTTPNAGKKDVFESTTGKGKLDKTGGKYKATIPTLKVPDIKLGATGSTLSFDYPAGRIDDVTGKEAIQSKTWDDAVAGDTAVATKIKEKTKAMNAETLVSKENPVTPVYVFRQSKVSAASQKGLIIGTLANLQQRIGRPYWSPAGKNTFYDVDHKKEMQLGGKNVLGNLWLLEASANRSSGSKIKIEKENSIQGLLAEARKEDPANFKDTPEPSEGQKMAIEFTSVVGGLPIEGDPKAIYEMSDIKAALPMDGLAPLTRPEMKALGLGEADQLTIFTNSTGGRAFKIKDLNPDEPKVTKALNKKIGNVKLNTLDYTRGAGGKINADFFEDNNKINPVNKDVPLKEMDGVPMAVYITDRELKSILGAATQIKLFSPIEFDEFSLDPDSGTVGRARILPNLPFLPSGFSLDLGFEGNDLFLEASLTGGQIKLPPPFKIYGGAIAVSLNGKGTLKASGSLAFGITGVGDGTVSGSVDSNGKFTIGGEFLFDKKLFDNAKVTVEYTDGQLTVKGTLQIPKGKITGIKQATAVVSYSGGTLTATGNAELDVKGLEKGSMNLKYNNELLEVGGEFTLSNEIPRIKGGKVNAKVVKKGEEYDISAGGTAQIDLPGFQDTTLTVAYANGAITVESTLQYEKGIAKGKVKIGATNRPVDESGQPAGEPGDKWIIYGKGELTLKLTPWLQASATVSLSPTGEMEVSGTIGIPNDIKVFDAKTINQPLLKFPTLQIPLLAIPLGPVSLGLVATIGGGIDFNASIGPGKLEALSATINYKPGQEDSISLSGKGKFVVPAEAMLRVYGNAGIGLSAAIASISGGIELGAGIGIKGAAEASVDVGWSPQAGVSLSAKGEVYVEPALNFDLKLFLEASVPFYKKKWTKTLAQKQFGSGMRFGLLFPINYKEGKDFNISMDDLQVIKPDLDVSTIIDNFKHELFD